MPAFPWIGMEIPLRLPVGNYFPSACFSTMEVQILPMPIGRVWLHQLCMDMIDAFQTPKQKLGEK